MWMEPPRHVTHVGPSKSLMLKRVHQNIDQLKLEGSRLMLMNALQIFLLAVRTEMMSRGSHLLIERLTMLMLALPMVIADEEVGEAPRDHDASLLFEI